MRINLSLSILTVFLVVFFCFPLAAQELTARQIMEKVEDRDDGDNATATMLMILIDKNKRQRKKVFSNFTKDFGKDERRIMFVRSPAPVKNTGFLTFDYDNPDMDDDQWLYLPEIGKTKRIATSDKDGSFMGSDLNYSDMTSRNLDDYEFTLLKEMALNKQPVWLIQSIPKSADVIDETGYKRAILAVRKDNYVVIRAKMWTAEGNYIKYMTAKKVEKIDGIWVVTVNHVVKKRGKAIVHQTLVQISDVKFNQNLDETLFTIRRLEKGLL